MLRAQNRPEHASSALGQLNLSIEFRDSIRAAIHSLETADFEDDDQSERLADTEKLDSDVRNEADPEVGLSQPPLLQVPIEPKSEAQRRYLDLLTDPIQCVAIGVGPPGTGKTRLAVEAAVAALEAGLTAKIILTVPSIHIGEGLGFFPGSAEDKLSNYLRGMLDVLKNRLGREGFEKAKENNPQHFFHSLEFFCLFEKVYTEQKREPTLC